MSQPPESPGTKPAEASDATSPPDPEVESLAAALSAIYDEVELRKHRGTYDGREAERLQRKYVVVMAEHLRAIASRAGADEARRWMERYRRERPAE